MQLPHDEQGNILVDGNPVAVTQAGFDRIADIIADVYTRAATSRLKDFRKAFAGLTDESPSLTSTGFGRFDRLPEITFLVGPPFPASSTSVSAKRNDGASDRP